MTNFTLDALDLAALLSSRICHDVISPVGAIVNGLEVLDEEKDDEMRGFALDLIKKSARTASARLQFCRLAFGAAGSSGASIDTGDAEQVARGLLADERTQVEWDAPRVLMSKNKVKLVLNLMPDRSCNDPARRHDQNPHQRRRRCSAYLRGSHGAECPPGEPRAAASGRRAGKERHRCARDSAFLYRSRRPRRQYERRHCNIRRQDHDRSSAGRGGCVGGRLKASAHDAEASPSLWVDRSRLALLSTPRPNRACPIWLASPSRRKICGGRAES